MSGHPSFRIAGTRCWRSREKQYCARCSYPIPAGTPHFHVSKIGDVDRECFKTLNRTVHAADLLGDPVCEATTGKISRKDEDVTCGACQRPCLSLGERRVLGAMW